MKLKSNRLSGFVWEQEYTVAVIIILTVIFSLYNFQSSYVFNGKAPNVKQNNGTNTQEDTAIFPTKNTLTRLDCAVNMIWCIAAFLSLLPFCVMGKDKARKFKRLLLVWIFWSIFARLWSLIYNGWVFENYPSESLPLALNVTTMPLWVYLIMRIYSFYEKLKEKDTFSENERGITRQSSAPALEARKNGNWNGRPVEVQRNGRPAEHRDPHPTEHRNAHPTEHRCAQENLGAAVIGRQTSQPMPSATVWL